MEIIHCLGKKSIKKTVDNLARESLMMGGRRGYLWIGQGPASHYQGWFFESDAGLVKIIESIEAKGCGYAEVFKNNFWNVEKIGDDIDEKFFLYGDDCLACEINKFVPLRIYLDIREPYKDPKLGRHYSVCEENGILLISYSQDNDFLMPQIFLAIAGDFDGFEIKNEWILREYELDKRRSASFQRWVFSPADLMASKLVFVAGAEKEKVVARAQNIWRNFDKVKKERSSLFDGNFSFLDFSRTKEGQMANICARKSLESLFCKNKESLSLRAGFPWFFQVWQRDEAVSLKGLDLFDKKSAWEIFWRQINELEAANFHFDTADGAGWLFLRVREFFEKGKLNVKETAALKEVLKESISWLLENQTENGLAITKGQKTWMDSLDRDGAPIEIQALRLNMYSLAADLTADKKQKKYYSDLESKLKYNTRQLFFYGKKLADRFNTKENKLDFTVRPNIFLAAYAYPNLLSKKEWQACFESALEKLWLDWGGVATIDKSDPRLHPRDTGENPVAYHNGDSWFLVNNIAAIVMSRTDYPKFKYYIDKIFEASKNDILWYGALGCASEISSAEIYESAGCPNQAWSAATFLELCQELKK